MSKERENKPRIVFWSIVGVGVVYMYYNVFKK